MDKSELNELRARILDYVVAEPPIFMTPQYIHKELDDLKGGRSKIGLGLVKNTLTKYLGDGGIEAGTFVDIGTEDQKGYRVARDKIIEVCEEICRLRSCQAS